MCGRNFIALATVIVLTRSCQAVSTDRCAANVPSLVSTSDMQTHGSQHLEPVASVAYHDRGVRMSHPLRLRGGALDMFRQWAFKALAKVGIFLKKGRLLVLGLDNAGKSTLLTVLLRNEVVPTAPTHQPVTDVIKIGHMKLRAVDMGGHEIARKMWSQYAHEADGIVYIVDAVDRERFDEAAIELHKLLASLPADAPVLILANKVDLPHAAQHEELYYALGLDELAQAGSNRPIGLYLCSIFERRGYEEGFEWLSSFI